MEPPPGGPVTESWEDAHPTVRRTVATPGGVVTMPVDVSKVLTTLETLADQMEDNAAQLAEADEAVTRSKVAYEIAFARAVLNAAGSNKEAREARALLDVQDIWTRWMLEDRVVRSLRERSFMLRDQMKTYQSISAIIRDAVSTTG